MQRSSLMDRVGKLRGTPGFRPGTYSSQSHAMAFGLAVKISGCNQCNRNIELRLTGVNGEKPRQDPVRHSINDDVKQSIVKSQMPAVVMCF
jgi:hypothetical protein